MHQKCIRNVSQIQPFLPRSQSLKYYKNQNKHTYFSLYYLYLSQIYPKFNLLSLYLSHSSTVKIQKIPNASEMHQKCIRNVSEMYPKFNLFSLDLSHSNTIKIKTSIHISPYITYIYPKFIPNSTFSPYISVTQVL